MNKELTLTNLAVINCTLVLHYIMYVYLLYSLQVGNLSFSI